MFFLWFDKSKTYFNAIHDHLVPDIKIISNFGVKTIWHGIVQYDMGMSGVVWYGAIWYGAVQCNGIQYSMVWYGMVRYGTVWYGTVWYGTVWYVVQYLVWYVNSLYM